MNRRNIAFCLRRDYETDPGGDTVQMETWCASLRSLGHEVRILRSPVRPCELDGVDLVFVWHLERVDESFPLWRLAKARNLPVVLVATYWHRGKRFPGFSVFKHLELILRLVRGGFRNFDLVFRSWAGCRRRMLNGSSRFIVNSEAERDLLVSEGADAARVTVIPNVIDSRLFADGELPAWQDRSDVVCVGHFCPRKNQLGLIRALRGTDLSVTFIGGARPMHRRYLRRCVAESRGRHRFLGRIGHGETVGILKRSRFSISASLAETPGIGNLEAAAAGCGMILPDLKPIREYFPAGAVRYMDPAHLDAGAVGGALAAPPPPELREHVMRNYTDRALPPYWEELMKEVVEPCAD